MDVLWPELDEYAPAIDRLKIITGWSGLYAVKGVSGHGLQQCHAIGRYLAEILRGVETFLDLSIFSPKCPLDNKPIFDGHGKLI